MIVYEVNLDVRDSVFEAYCAWLGPHVAEILKLPGFTSAEIFERSDPPATSGVRALTVWYRIVDESSLRRYFSDHAPRLRADGLQRFGDAVSATRRVLVPMA